MFTPRPHVTSLAGSQCDTQIRANKNESRAVNVAKKYFFFVENLFYDIRDPACFKILCSVPLRVFLLRLASQFITFCFCHNISVADHNRAIAPGDSRMRTDMPTVMCPRQAAGSQACIRLLWPVDVPFPHLVLPHGTGCICNCEKESRPACNVLSS